MVKLLIKKLHKNIILPEYKTDGSSGMDLMANVEQTVKILPGEKKIISTGIMVAIPEQYEIQIRPRSGLAAKNGISVLNTPGTIDSDYRGEIKVILINLGKDIFQINKNDRIAQMIVCPIIKVELKEVESLPETARGEGGFGSTNK
jgi:dUTP pyrophosphatase|tara:strand:+ start:1269 stop:1706 length:438 start_codon:yes stop_codon:yes gene_type:complete